MEECRGRYRHRKSDQIVRIGLARSTAVRRVGWPLPARRPRRNIRISWPERGWKNHHLEDFIRACPSYERESLLLGQPAGDVATRGRIGFLPESPYFYDYLTAEEFLGFYGQLAGLDRAAISQRGDGSVETRRACGCTHQAIAEILQGHAATIGLAQALIHDPELIILDEPMTGLDPIGRKTGP